MRSFTRSLSSKFTKRPPAGSRASAIPFVEVLGMVAQSLWSNKLRTGLTMLGIIIGIASVIAITSVGQGIQAATEQRIQALGTNIILVLAGASRNNGIDQGTGSATTLTWADAKAVAEQAPAVQAVTAFLDHQTQIVYSGQNTSTTVVGTDLNYPDVKNVHPQEGRFFTQDELDFAQPVVVLGSKVRDAIFGTNANSLGADVQIQKGHYRVIGVMESKSAVGGQDTDDRVYIPLTNASARLVGKNAITGVAISGFYIKCKHETQLDAAQFQVTNLLRLRHNIYPPQPDDFRIINQVDIINTYTTVVTLFTILVVAIAGISLVVGGIGIGNIICGLTYLLIRESTSPLSECLVLVSPRR